MALEPPIEVDGDLADVGDPQGVTQYYMRNFSRVWRVSCTWA
jgi:hypothetical protein